jgi:transglutaminase/protease-like cytokinesis protein 3
MDGRVSKQQYTTDWLFLKPDHFLYTHYPENSNQQLLATPLTAAQFSALPFFKPKFFELADNLSVALKKINKVDSNLSFNYTTKDGYRLSFTVSNYSAVF